MKHTYIYIVLFLLLLAGCEHDRSIFDGDLVPVRIVPSLDEAAPAGTRVVDVTWTANDPVGVSISSDATTFKEYKASATETSVTLTPKDAANTLYYPSTGTVTFRAFCPYKAPSGNVVTYDAFTDQSISAKMQAVDLVYHSGATGSKSTAATPVNMSFQHKFSKVVITATRGAGVTDNLSTLAMTLTGMPTSTTFNVSTGALGTASGTGTITPEHYSKAEATTIAHAIIAPHAAKADRTITFAVGSLNYSYAIPDGLAFETGKTYAFNLTLTQTAPVLSGSTITAWNGGTIAWDGAGSSLTAPTEVTHYKAATTNNTMVIKTTHANTPGLQFSTSPTDATAGAPGWLTQVGSLQKTVTGNPNEYTLTYNVLATTGNRACYIYITVGTMTVVTKVNQLFQDPVGLSINQSLIEDLTGEGLTGSIEFTSGIIPSLDLNGVTWLTNAGFSYVSGTTWKLNYTLPPNITAYRSGSIKVNAGTDQATVSVTQNVVNPALSLTTRTISDDSGNGISTTSISFTCHALYTPTISNSSMVQFADGYSATITGTAPNWKLNYNLPANNSVADRIGTITVTAGSMSATITFNQKFSVGEPAAGASNCFIVPLSGSVSIPLTRPIYLGYAAGNATFTMEVLWKDANCISGTPTVSPNQGSGAKLNVTATGTTGNAVIAVKVGSTIVWSYHIWVTNYNPNAATFVNNGLTFMDRNLGATTVGAPASDITNTSNTTGLYYQWGRKDPFPATGAPDDIQPGGGSFTASPANVTSSTGTIDYAIKNPNVFLKAGSASSYDWYFGGGSGGTNRNNTLWGHDGAKTVYDPCPAGWRVPQYTSAAGAISEANSPWKGFTTSSGPWTAKRGRNWGTNAYYQASGFRYCDSGTLGNVGDNGYYWSASPYSSTDNNAGHLHFNSSHVYPATNSVRANGYPVRCVQE